MTQNSNIEIIQQILAAFGAADIPAILALLTDDVVIEFYGPSTSTSSNQRNSSPMATRSS
jgi:ketosteroid isomerase-like protein